MGKGLINPSSNINLVIGHIQNTNEQCRQYASDCGKFLQLKG